MSQLTRWEPFRDLISLREAMDQLLKESYVRPGTEMLASRAAGALAVDMYETDEAVVVKTATPGVDPEDIDISITGDTLTIKGETKVDEEIEEENYLCRERRYGAFSRSLTIPVAVQADEAEAEFEDGVLTLMLPKAEQVKPKAIEIKAK
ncbi:MAG: Hsp20/alpha crystallin family protein [Anaerolineae bacterium]|nr:Hsp20/alpha crystallin family protein [Anaerolineae bacterium]